MAKQNPAYKLLRDQGMRPEIARHFLVALRKRGFVIVKEAEIASGKKIVRQVETIVKLMKAQRGRK